MNTATVAMAVTPTVLSTFLHHYLHRKPLRERPTAHLSYDEGLHLIRSFLHFASHHTVEDLQAFTAQWVPYPQWVKVKEVEIPDDVLIESAAALEKQLGPEGIRKVGGSKWWQWRQPKSPLKAEWIEMRSDYNRRIKLGDPGKRVMLYVHGGAYFFGSVDEHRYQMQRHARKLKARVFAPEYRLAPQFPFPCGLQDCLAAYLYLLRTQDPSTIILAGDSAGGGMVLSMLVIMRDQGIPLPAGGILISPWVDLTHSFPSVSGDCPLDYIPPYGFHHKPSVSWPPLNADEYNRLKDEMAQRQPGSGKLANVPSLEANVHEGQPDPGAGAQGSGPRSSNVYAETTYLSIKIDGEEVILKDQIQMYATNELISHPLVSPVMQPSLGGLPPLLIMTGGGEILRDEQIYLAHKCANPAKYPPGDIHLSKAAKEQISRFKPTDVQFQIWDDLCHVAPTLSFTRPAKHMYRSVAQFGAWALARAQNTGIEILDDDEISVISQTSTESESKAPEIPEATGQQPRVGKAGDPLPPFENHMIRQRVDRHGIIRPMEPATELPGCAMDPNEIGVIKVGPVRKWLDMRRQWDLRYGKIRAKIHKKRLEEMIAGYQGFDGEVPPPSSLAARRKAVKELSAKKKKKSTGLALWSLLGSKHDESTMQREQEAEKTPEVKVATKQEGHGARSPSDLERQAADLAHQRPPSTRSGTRTTIVKDEYQTLDGESGARRPIESLMAKREGITAGGPEQPSSQNSDSLSPPLTGVAGKRPIVGGIAVPFSLDKEAETASMITLTSAMDQSMRVGSPTSMDGQKDDASVFFGPATRRSELLSVPGVYTPGAVSPLEEHDLAVTPGAVSPLATPMVEGGNVKDGEELLNGGLTTPGERPVLETFVTAEEDLPRVH
ncbi:alpha/beta-hydrolase [Xylariaceae sp. FL0594]|nr:alpha/beta-hydrolase [Xylariaceae sp. FL0594]